MNLKPRLLIIFFLIPVLTSCTGRQIVVPGHVPVEEKSIDSGATIDDPVTAPGQSAEVPADPFTDMENLVGSETANPAVVALLTDSKSNAAAGDIDSALASLERAVRIDPKNPVIWHQMAKLRLAQGNWEQAILLAEKSNTLVASNPSIKKANWLVIAKAKAATGDDRGAGEARKKFSGN